MYSKLWGIVDGKKMYLVGALVAIRGIVVFCADGNLLSLIDNLIAAAGIVAGRSTIDKFVPKQPEK
jgi:hypothetical protein